MKAMILDVKIVSSGKNRFLSKRVDELSLQRFIFDYE
jgi:hypothetical protein